MDSLHPWSSLTCVQMVAFDKAIKGKDENSLNEMWSITASLGLWLNGGVCFF